jgi:hypothetical protein
LVLVQAQAHAERAQAGGDGEAMLSVMQAESP